MESSEEDDKNTHAAIFDVKFGPKKEDKGVITDSRERTADTLFNDPECVALAIEGSDLNTIEDNFVPTAKCIQDTKGRQLATRSGLQGLACSVYHLHHEQAMKSPLRVRQFFKTMLQHVHNFKVDVIAGDANAAAYKYFKKQQYQDLYNSSVAVMLREMQREVNEGRPFESRLHLDSHTHNHFSQLISASDLDCCFMAILSWRKPHGPRIMRESWSISRVRMHGNENRRGEDSSFAKGIEVLLTETAKKGYPDPENVDNPMSAPLGYDVRQSKRVLELQNRDLTKITSVHADTCIQFRGPVCLSLVLMTIFLTVCYLPFTPSFVTMSSSKPIGARRMSEWYKELTDKDDDPHSPFQVARVRLLLGRTDRHTRNKSLSKNDEAGLAIEKEEYTSSPSTSSSVSTSSNSYDENKHNMWNPLLELFCHVQIGLRMATLVDVVSTARVALSCHFAFDLLCDQNDSC